jgi:hypothetical protein
VTKRGKNLIRKLSRGTFFNQLIDLGIEGNMEIAITIYLFYQHQVLTTLTEKLAVVFGYVLSILFVATAFILVFIVIIPRERLVQ